MIGKREATVLARQVLERVADQQPMREERKSQRRMCQLVLNALIDDADLAVRAGPLTGKTFGYAVAAAVYALTHKPGGPIVIACPNDAAQDQLMTAMPDIRSASLSCGLTELYYGALKGRNNYLCEEALSRVVNDPSKTHEWQPHLERIEEWTKSTPTGDLTTLEGNVPADLLDKVGGGSCPHQHPYATSPSTPCYADIALRDARQHHLLIVSHLNYVRHLNSANELLPEHGAVIIEEADSLLDVVAQAKTKALTLNSQATEAIIVAARALQLTQSIVSKLIAILEGREQSFSGEGALGSLRRRLQHHELVFPTGLPLPSSVRELFDLVRNSQIPYYMFVRRERGRPQLCAAPMHPLQWLNQKASTEGPLIMCSSHFTRSLQMSDLNGLTRHRVVQDADEITLYRQRTLCYLPRNLPDPVQDAVSFRAETLAQMVRLISSCWGRTLILSATTQDRDDIYDILKVFEERLGIRLLRQDDLPPTELLKQLQTDETTVVCAVGRLWWSVDTPGDTLELVIVDKVPFANPSRPLVWSEGDAAPVEHGDYYAERMLAQAAYRLIRTKRDRGVIALLDSRYWDTLADGRDLLSLAPPMRKTADSDEALEFLKALQRS